MKKTDAPYIGQSVLRSEDDRLLRGEGLFTADIQLPRMLHMAIVRSPHAHAEIENIDASAALAMPGVVGVLTGDDLDGVGLLESVGRPGFFC